MRFQESCLWRSLVIVAMILSIVIAPLPRVVQAESPPFIPQPASFAHIYVTAAEAEELTNGTLSPLQISERLIELRNRAENSTVTKVDDLFNQVVADGFLIPAPVGPTGEPIGPPIRLPEGPDGKPNPWKKIPGTPDRPWKWIPTRPVTNPDGGGQPGGSWDSKDGHWDVDNGRGVRTRWLPDGTSVGEDHKPTKEPEAPPPPFTGVDPVPYIILGVVIIIVIIVVISTGGAAAPAIALVAAVPASP